MIIRYYVMNINAMCHKLTSSSECLKRGGNHSDCETMNQCEI